MKTLSALTILLLSFAAIGQVPDAMNFQAVARDATGQVLAQQAIEVSFTIRSGSASGIIVYSEDQNQLSTNQFGLFSTQIGLGTPVQGIFSGIDWSANQHWLEIAVNGVTVGALQLVTVPYALLARNVEHDAVDDADADPTNELQQLSIEGNELTISQGNTVSLPSFVPDEPPVDLNDAYHQGTFGAGRIIVADEGAVLINSTGGLHVTGDVGIGTTTPAAKLHVVGTFRFADGTQGPGKVLTSDGLGSASWQTPAASGVTLNGAYNYGGPGAGRSINAVDGAVWVMGEDGFQVTGTLETGDSITISGEGSRMFFNPNKGAFRAGAASGTEWDNANVGATSVAMGSGNTASNQASIAVGTNNTSSGSRATALGWGNSSSGLGSAALGSFNIASGTFSTAIGLTCEATGDVAMSLGNSAFASGSNSVAIGSNVSTNGYEGAVIIGDHSVAFPITTSSAAQEFTARFAGGYRLFSNSALTSGVSLASGGNAWLVVSDRNKKENLLTVDAEEILRKIGAMELSTWNYKEQDPATMRHYGPMAQDFYAAFGSDAFGTMGNDTTINQADFDGINMIGVQALEHRTTDLKASVLGLQTENAELRTQLETLKRTLDAQSAELMLIKTSLGLKVEGN